MTTRYRLRYTDGDKPMWMDRRSRPESGRKAWRGWLLDRLTDRPQDAYTWAKSSTAQAFAERYNRADKYTVEAFETPSPEGTP